MNEVVRFEVFTAVTKRNAVSEEYIVSIIRVTRTSELGTKLAVTEAHCEAPPIYLDHGGDTFLRNIGS
jgi:hypothetical protein